MKLLLVVVCALWEASALPYYPYYGSNMDSMSYGATDSHGAMVMSRFYQPYYNPRMNAGMAAFMFQPQAHAQAPNQAYYVPDRRRQTAPDSYLPQQNEVYPPEQVYVPTAKPEDPTTEKAFTTTISAPEVETTVGTVPELIEPEVEDVEIEKPKKRVTKKKQVKKPVEDEEEDFMPKMPGGVMFPMFFGWGGRSGDGEAGPIAIANAYSTARGGVASSHATAYGAPRPDVKYSKGL